MRPYSIISLIAAGAIAAPLAAQQQVAKVDTASNPIPSAIPDARTTSSDSASRPEAGSAASLLMPNVQIQHYRPNDQRGINVFEAPKQDVIPFTGFRLGFGAAFLQEFQGLGHANSASPLNAKDATGNTYNANQLMAIGHGPNNAVANAYVNAQLAPGIRVAVSSYLSARHHNETWMKDGYLLVDDSPIDFLPLKVAMAFTTIRVGEFEINYGDSHFRRSDNGQGLYDPLVGNYIVDAFATQAGGEALFRVGPMLAMGGMTNGEEKGMVQNAAKRAPAFYGKIGADRQVNPLTRVRLTGSLYSQARASNEVLFSGDRGGSPYYDVLENVASSEANQAWSGQIQPFSGPSAGLHSAVINPFLKVGGVEYFGNFERARGRGLSEKADRQITQVVNELTYRFLGDKLYASGRYNTVSGRLAGMRDDISVDRTQIGGGWFITPLVLAKGEWVTQQYNDFPLTDIRHGGRFSGFMLAGAVSF